MFSGTRTQFWVRVPDKFSGTRLPEIPDPVLLFSDFGNGFSWTENFFSLLLLVRIMLLMVQLKYAVIIRKVRRDKRDRLPPDGLIVAWRVFALRLLLAVCLLRAGRPAPAAASPTRSPSFLGGSARPVRARWAGATPTTMEANWLVFEGVKNNCHRLIPDPLTFITYWTRITPGVFHVLTSMSVKLTKVPAVCQWNWLSPYTRSNFLQVHFKPLDKIYPNSMGDLARKSE